MVSANKYSQLDKNTVDAANQLHGEGPVRFLNPTGKGRKIMLVGNSMTLHGVNEPIGWHRECGMAASAPERDYVHRLQALLAGDCVICICQVSAWERDYKTGSDLLSRYAAARDFGADVVVLRAVENCPKDAFDPALFRQALEQLLRYLNPKGGKLVLTTGFWHHPGDDTIRALAQDWKTPLVEPSVGADAHIGPSSVTLVELGDLGERDEMKAIGLYAHKGVANHPGDAGMSAMASRIHAAMDNG